MDERVIKWANEHDGDEWCNYCRYSDECDGGVKGHLNGPIFPACVDSNLDMFLDEEALIEAIENVGEEI